MKGAPFIICLMLLFATSYAEEDNWIYVSKREDHLWFVNTDSIICKENNCKAWVKMQSLLEKYEYTIGLNEYNCMEMKYKILRTTKHDSNGNTIISIPPVGQEWNYIVPESISKELYDFTCKKTSNQKDQQNTDKKDVEKVAEENLAKKGEEEKVVESIKKVQALDSFVLKEVRTQNKMTEDKNEAKENSPQPRKPSEAIFTVQVGAFRNASYAKALATKLDKKGYKTYITLIGSRKAGKLYKVWIGIFYESEKANILSEKIKNSEGLQTFIISLQP